MGSTRDSNVLLVYTSVIKVQKEFGTNQLTRVISSANQLKSTTYTTTYTQP